MVAHNGKTKLNITQLENPITLLGYFVTLFRRTKDQQVSPATMLGYIVTLNLFTHERGINADIRPDEIFKRNERGYLTALNNSVRKH